MKMFKKVLQRIATGKGKDAVSIWCSIALPGVNETKINKETGIEETKFVRDPQISSQDMLDVLTTHIEEKELADWLCTRAIKVRAMDPARKYLIDYIAEYPNADSKELEEVVQKFLEDGWNVNLNHPKTAKAQASAKRKEADAQKTISEMETAKLNELLAARGMKVVKA